MSDQIEIKINRSFDASAEQAFDAFLDPVRAEQFLFKSPNGEMIQVEIDAQVGGAFAIIERRPEGDAEHYGTYLEIDRPRTLAFTFGVGRDTPQESMVTLEFSPKGPSGCEVTLTNLISAKQAQFKERSKSGWIHILTGLGKILTPTDHARKIETKDSNGTVLAEGDSVKTIKDLKVKGSSMVVKRGTVVRGIRLIDGSDSEIDCKVDGTSLYLETRWLQKI